jgi:tol-pal system protein YbgF
MRNTPSKVLLFCFLCLTGGMSQLTWAAAPVIDLNQEIDDTTVSPISGDMDQSQPPSNKVNIASRESLPLEERVRLLEQQLSNLTQMDLPGKIDKLQQQVQQLNGQLEVQVHDIQNLNDQQSKFYQDLNQRLTESKSKSPTNPSSASKIAQAEANVTQNAVVAQKASAAADIVTTGSEQGAYQKAFNLLADKKNDQALPAFQAFLKTYPKGAHAPNAHYWLGELYLTDNKNDLASAEFTTVIQKFPNYSKVPDAMLKLAIIHANAGQGTQAQAELKNIIARFPSSSAARLAKKQLKESTPPAASI